MRDGRTASTLAVRRCPWCAAVASWRDNFAWHTLHDSLTDSERLYCVAKLGPNALERIFGEAVLA